MNRSHVTFQEGFAFYGVPTVFTHMHGFLVYHFDVMIQASLSIGCIVTLFAEVPLDLLMHIFNMLSQVTSG